MHRAQRQILIVGGLVIAVGIASLVLRATHDRSIAKGLINLGTTLWCFWMLWERTGWMRWLLAVLCLVGAAAATAILVLQARSGAMRLDLMAFGMASLATLGGTAVWLARSRALVAYLRTRLPLSAIAAAAPSIAFYRNDRMVTAERHALGDLVVERSVRIADREMIDLWPDLPVALPSSTYPVVAYRWLHQGRGTIDVCVAIMLRRSWPTRSGALVIGNDIRPDLDAGIIVDSGEITIRGANAITCAAGLGDGYYPVHRVRDLFGRTAAIVVDFEVWKAKRYVLSGGQSLDEYGMVVTTPDA
ncbi:MAG TPA: hypothetical protein VEL07_13640 [Planctomycetota bacterium]|nr:hypothetical protein [Planctomycetota bacterium]